MTIPPVTSHLKSASAMDNAGARPNKAVFKLPKSLDRTQPIEPQVRPIAQILVAQTFYGPLLKQSEESPFKDERLTGGQAGKTWNSLFHQRLAEQMTGSKADPSKPTKNNLVESIVKKMARQFGHGQGKKSA